MHWSETSLVGGLYYLSGVVSSFLQMKDGRIKDRRMKGVQMEGVQMKQNWFGCDRAQRYRKYLRAAVIGLLCLQLFACGTLSIAASASEQITVEALATEIEQGRAPLILDVRSPEEYAEGHIPGAVNIPHREVPNQLDTLRELSGELSSELSGESNDKSGEPVEVIIYCERGVRAAIAEDSLIEAGFTSTIQLTGHMKAWRDSNLPVEVGELLTDQPRN